MTRLLLRSAVFSDGLIALSPSDLPMTIGRSHRADLTINDRQLSRIHAEIRCTSDGQFEIIDRESTNLTIVNQRDVESCVLKTGDVILLGETELLVDMDNRSADPHEKTTREIPLVRNPNETRS